MNKQLLLVEVPRDHPHRNAALKAFKQKHQIETKYSPGCEKPWLAAWMGAIREAFQEYGVTTTTSLPEAFAKVCRLISEAGLDGYGDTEREAIRDLCDLNKIPCDLD